MKLKNVESKELLPSWAGDAEWLQNGLDLAVRSISTRIPGMGAPFTLDAVKALSDEELEALYEQIGIVKYYPDLSRSTRESFIFEIYTSLSNIGTHCFTPSCIPTTSNLLSAVKFVFIMFVLLLLL